MTALDGTGQRPGIKVMSRFHPVDTLMACSLGCAYHVRHTLETDLAAYRRFFDLTEGNSLDTEASTQLLALKQRLREFQTGCLQTHWDAPACFWCDPRADCSPYQGCRIRRGGTQ